MVGDTYFDHILVRITVIVMILISIFIFSSLGYNRKLILDNKIMLQHIEEKLNQIEIEVVRLQGKKIAHISEGGN
jgi:hypothetical protein